MKRIMQEIKKLLPWLLRTDGMAVILLIIGVVVLGTGFFFLYFGTNSFTFRQLVTDLYANGGTEFLSIFITVFIIDRRNKARALQERKEEVIVQLGSPYEAIADQALRICWLKEWLYDGSLKGARLLDAKLPGADLRHADLQDVNLARADLSRAWLRNSNLRGAILQECNLQGASLVMLDLRGQRMNNAQLQGALLERVNLQGANLGDANLEGADLGQADLQSVSLRRAILKKARLGGANLQNANLAGANLSGAILNGANLTGVILESSSYGKAIFDPETRLPDNSKWTPTTDMTRYTKQQQKQNKIE